MSKKHFYSFFLFVFNLFLGGGIPIYAQRDLILHELITSYKQDEDYIRRIGEDKFGLVWFQTFSRIYRFDGTDIVGFEHVIKVDFTLKDAFVFENKILLNYDNKRLRLFDIENLGIVDVELPDNVKNFKQVFFKNKGNIYFITKNAVYQTALIGNKIIEKRIIEQTSGEMVYPITEVYTVHIIGDKIILKNNLAKTTKEILNFSYPLSYSNNSNSIILCNLDSIAIIKNDEIHRVDIKTLPNEGFFDCKYASGKYIVVSNQRLIMIDPESLEIEFRNFIYPAEFHIQLNWNFAFFIKSNGDFYLENRKKLFRGSLNNFNVNGYFGGSTGGISNFSNIRTAYFDSLNNQILLGVEGFGVMSMKREKNKSIFSKFPESTLDFSPQLKVINKIIRLDTNEIFVSNNMTSQLLGKRNRMLNIFAVWDVFKENDSIIWCVGNNISGVVRYNILSNISEMFSPDLPDIADLSGWDIEPYKNYLFISTTKGLFVFNRNTHKFNGIGEFAHLNQEINDRVWCSKVVEGDILYVATQGNGLFKIDLSKHIFSQPLKNAINTFYIETFDNKNIWVVSSKKLCYLDGAGKSFDLLLTKFDLPEEVSFHGLTKLRNDELMVCGKGGFSIINTKKIIDKIYAYKSINTICKVRVNENEILGNVSNQSALTLPFDSNTISLTIANNLLDNAEDIKIRYLLKGYDKDYTEAENTNNITYKNLPYGNYTLDIFVCNSLGIWDEMPTQLFIKILPPWYYSILAKIVYALLFVGILAGIFYLLKLRFEKQKKQELMLAESELKAIRSQLNPHFVFNSLNSIQSHILGSKKEIATAYLIKFAKLLRRILDYSSSESITLGDEIAWINDYFELEALRFDNKLQWEIKVDDALVMGNRIPSLVIQPVIENALIHGLFPKKTVGTIFISYSLNPDSRSITCKIRDDGVGRRAVNNPFRSSHDSKGTMLTEQRLEYLTKRYNIACGINITDLLDENGGPAGTLVTIIIPIIERKE